ncbi:MAG: LysR family transcriptional regulator [Ideonella sp.]|nr:LysR family transcriptional regulator [Ideonella sp.]
MNFRTLDLNLLRVFDAVMAEGSLTRAARVLSMTQPAVSHALRRLHEAVGEPLFVRAATGMKPTPLGQALWPQVHTALTGLRQALAPEAYDPARDAVVFRLTMADSIAAQLLRPLVAAVERTSALADFRVVPLLTRDPRGELERNEVDLAVGFFPAVTAALSAHGADSPLRHARLFDTEWVCAMRRGHPLSGALTLDAFCAAHHALVSFSGRAYGLVDEALAGIGRQRRIVLTVNQFYTASHLAARSDLLTVLPAGFVEDTGLADSLVVEPLPVPMGRVQVAMLWHVRHDGDPAHRWLREQMASVAKR